MGIILFILGVVFVVLKLVHIVDWSWWLITLPFYAALALTLILLVIMAITGSIAAGVTAGVKAVTR